MNKKQHPTTDLNRIIELAAKWQDKFYWAEGHKMFARFQEHRDKASADWIVASKIAAEGRESEQLELFRNGARRHEELSKFYHSQVIDAHRELLELKNLVRQHWPTLLHFVPDGNFVADEPNADITQQLRDLKQLEGQVRAMLVQPATPPATTPPTLPFGLHLCDVRQTLKREGFRGVAKIPNEGHWELMEALIEASPNAVPESKLKQLNLSEDDRDNYRRALKSTIDAIGLTVERWVLKDVQNRP